MTFDYERVHALRSAGTMVQFGKEQVMHTLLHRGFWFFFFLLFRHVDHVIFFGLDFLLAVDVSFWQIVPALVGIVIRALDLLFLPNFSVGWNLMDIRHEFLNFLYMVCGWSAC